MIQKLDNKPKDVLFANCKQKAINYLEKYFKDKNSWANDKIDKVANLKAWPASIADLHHVPASAKGLILKGHLKAVFPDSKFSIVKPHYGSLHVKFLGGVYPFGLQKVLDLYVNPGNSDLQSDYYDYDISILPINDLNGDQWFYNGPDEALHALDKLIANKKLEGADYYDKHIKYLIDLLGVKSV